MAYKLIKNIAKSKSFRWGLPIVKYNTLDITQETLKKLYDKGCELVVETNEKPKKVKTNESKAKKSDVTED
tara:strand:- start:667 stop:879 length:213 start_codon:yes stop_codon:yes gene_type:complete